jgi:cobalamin biosynthesis protein CbiG
MGSLWIGMGYQSGVSTLAMEQAIAQVFIDFQLDLLRVQGLGTIDRKANHPEIYLFCQTKGWQLQFFSAAELAIVTVPHPSLVISTWLGTPTVAEGAAILAAGESSQLIVTKQICGQAGKALIIAVARVADADKIGCC